jgi:hypothetical protein
MSIKTNLNSLRAFKKGKAEYRDGGRLRLFNRKYCKIKVVEVKVVAFDECH